MSGTSLPVSFSECLLKKTDFIVWLPLFCDSRDLGIMYIVIAY